MSDEPTKPMAFGQPALEPEKNRWLFGMRLRIEPYHKGPVAGRTLTKKQGKPDPFAVVISTPKDEP
jgi:hypothetical protein